MSFLLSPASILPMKDVMKCISCFVTTQGSHSCSCSVSVVWYRLWIEFECIFSVLCDIWGLDSGVVEVLGLL